MNKTMHLISNAHLDPIWQWEWEEGCASAVATFRCAARFCREFDNYIFCHNEALIYRWVEEYDPALFREIRELVRLGKWHIMGGWHVQPDCNMPSGEAFVRQITEGRRYFREKFGVEPTTAINFDPFGHTRGLVQILAGTGYDSYIFCRPHEGLCHLPAETFRWVGYDGSSVIAQRSQTGYSTALGNAMKKIRPTTEALTDAAPLGFCLWGVGNHGGGPSREDIRAINAFMEEAKAEGVTVLHSTPEAYFADVRAEAAAGTRILPEHHGDLTAWAQGCYTSQVLIKQKYRQTENSLFSAEKAVSHAVLLGLMEYPEKEFGEALYDLLTVQFHDVLPGTSIQPAEEGAIRMLDHALELLSRVRMRAFMALSAGQEEAAPGEIPVLVYNPHPWPVETDLTCEFMLADQNWSGSFMMPVAYRGRQKLPSQCEKEYSNLPLDWRKRIVFRATLAPMSMNRFDCKLIALDKKPVPDAAAYAAVGEDGRAVLRVTTPIMTVDIGCTTGLVERWCVRGVDFLGSGACALDVMRDANDSWGMLFTSWHDRLGSFTLLSDEEGSRFSDLDTVIPSVRVIEDGELRVVIEAVFGYEGSGATVRYAISRVAPQIDLDIRIINQTKRRLIKLRLPQALPDPVPVVETAFGEEPMHGEGREEIGQKFLTVTSSNGARLSVLNRGIYGSSFLDGSVYLTLLRSPGYTAHPIEDRQVMPTDRYSEHMEQGERQFSLRLLAGAVSDRDTARQALAFNEAPMVLNLFPSGQEAQSPAPAEMPLLTLSPAPVVLTACKRTEDGADTLLRLFNPTGEPVSCTVCCPQLGVSETLGFGAFQVRTFRAGDGRLTECRMDEAEKTDV